MPKRRVIDLRQGDELQHGKRAYLIKGVEAYRENRISNGRAQTDPPSEGYVVRE